MSCAERKRFVKKCGLLTSEHFGDNKQKISPNLAKRTDFLVHKAQVLVGVTGFEPAASTSQTLKYRFFPYFTRLFGAFVSENGAFRCSSSHCFHVVRSRRWSKMWSNYNHPRFRAEEFIQCHSQINLINRKYYTINSFKSQDYISGEFVTQSILSTLKN